MTAQTNKKNTSIKRKLVPATAMLLASAMALASSTYAWFTMSREVEVTGIHMTATVPESIQLSLGKGMNTSTGLNSQTIDTASLRLTAVTAPDDDEFWSNTVDISEYYQFGRLTPATSAKGDDIFYTSDVTGVGKTLKGQTITTNGIAGGGTISASFAQADAADALGASNKTAAVAAISNRTATSTPITAATDSYINGGAYYIDVPVWFRTSISDANVSLAVKATFTQGTNDYTMADASNAKGDQLYKAARVSILEGNNTTTTTNTAKQGVIMTSDTSYYRTEAGANLTESADPYTVNATAGTWTKVVPITQYSTTNTDGKVANGAADAVVTITKASSGSTWSAAAPYTIRIWLDGEDVNCWNATAGQDFGIALSFCQIAAS